MSFPTSPQELDLLIDRLQSRVIERQQGDAKTSAGQEARISRPIGGVPRLHNQMSGAQVGPTEPSEYQIAVNEHNQVLAELATALSILEDRLVPIRRQAAAATGFDIAGPESRGAPLTLVQQTLESTARLIGLRERVARLISELTI
jgi:hypothetical protein